MKPSTRLKSGLKRAMRRRYGYAALRTFRDALGRAVADHLERSTGPRPYVSEADQLYALYWRGLKQIQRRWPRLSLTDVRAEP